MNVYACQGDGARAKEVLNNIHASNLICGCGVQKSLYIRKNQAWHFFI